MPGSWGYFKRDIKEYLTNTYPQNYTVLDIGCGAGDYHEMLSEHFTTMDAVEVWEPYLEEFNLRSKYRNVFNIDIMDFEFDFYDIIIMGDILEHLSRENAIKLIDRIYNKCKQLIVVVPYYLPQGVVNNNPYEQHLQPDIDDSIMQQYFPMLQLHKFDSKDAKLKIEVGNFTYYYCVFTKK